MRHLKKNIGIFARVLSAYRGSCNIKRQFKGKRGGGDGGAPAEFLGKSQREMRLR